MDTVDGTDSGEATPGAAGGRSHGTVSVGGHPVYYETQGSGEPIVLLHGGMATNATWEAQFQGLAPHRLVVAPERTGHGHTPDRPGPLSYEQMEEETVGVLRGLGLGPVDLLGWSDGGMVGLRLAAHHPELVRTLVMTGAGFSSEGYVPGAIDDLVGTLSDDEEMALFLALYADASPDGPEHFGVVWDKVRTLWAEPFDWSADLERVHAPTLVMVGDDDYISVGHAEELARRVAQGQLAVIPGASHVVPMEKPEIFNQLVLEFIAAPEVTTMLPLWRQDGD